MNQAVVKEKIFNIEGELEFLKRSLLKEPDFNIDKKNWEKVKSRAKKARKEVYQKLYEEK